MSDPVPPQVAQRRWLALVGIRLAGVAGAMLGMVLAARLSDAAFFWENDLRTPLAGMAGKLDAVTFHNRLGTQGQRIARIAALARAIAPFVGAEPEVAARAAGPGPKAVERRKGGVDGLLRS